MGKNEPAQTVSKPETHEIRFLLSVWWDLKGIVYFEFLPCNQTVNSVVYIQLSTAMQEKRPELTKRRCDVFHQTSLVTRQKLLRLP